MRRRLTGLLASLSLLLSVLFMSAWVGSILRLRPVGLEWHVVDDHAQAHHVLLLMSGDGSVGVASIMSDYGGVRRDRWTWLRDHDLSGPALQRNDNVYFFPAIGAPFVLYPRGWCHAGFGWGSGSRSPGDSTWTLGVPWWSLAALAATAPAWRMARTRRQCRRLGRGLCPRCGYDLRETPGRCPECGLDVASRRPALEAAARRHTIVFKLMFVLALCAVVTAQTVRLYRAAAHREEQRRFPEGY